MSEKVGSRLGQDRRRCTLALERVLSFIRLTEHGEDTSFEFVAAIGPIMFMILMIAFVVIVRSSQMPAWSAASECARSAIATLDESIGRRQGDQAARLSLHGNAIDASAGWVTISGAWSPGSSVTCIVSYNIDVSQLGFFADITGGKVPVVAKVTMKVEPFKSKWQDVP